MTAAYLNLARIYVRGSLSANHIPDKTTLNQVECPETLHSAPVSSVAELKQQSDIQTTLFLKRFIST